MLKSEESLKMQDEIFHCKKCTKQIGGHNQYLHDGMCDDCFFEVYFPEDAQVVETDLEMMKRHCNSKPIQRENNTFKEFVKSSDEFSTERLMKIVQEIKDKIECSNKECCSIFDVFKRDNVDLFVANAEICPVVFNVLENAKEEFLEAIFAFENPDI